MTTAFNLVTKRIITESKYKKVDDDLIQIWEALFEQAREKLTTYKIYKLPGKQSPNVILTMTTCKRLNLFTQTINSILNTWLDLPKVDQFIVIDDNSSNEDRKAMTSQYPFITYIMKTYNQKGHLESMNMIFNILNELTPEYWIHIEDDFLFFEQMTYVTTGIEGINKLTHFNVKQIMFNRNYLETMDKINMDGHIPYSDNTYSLHDYKPQGGCCMYWPYFSFRPSIIDVNAILTLGNFDSPKTFFEMEYAKRWMNAGYRTAFLNTVTNIHIGRLCNASGDNAYSLNEVPQFDGQRFDANYNIKVINIEERTDRMQQISTQLENECIKYQRIDAVNGKTLTMTPLLLTLFKGNDFGFRRGVIGCALSHYYLWKQLLDSTDPYYVVMEDDATLCHNFNKKLSKIIKQSGFDILFVGYHMTTANKESHPEYTEETEDIKIEELKKELYIGGTYCYIITRNGASALIDYIDFNGIKHGIDYLMAKVQNMIKVHETVPFITLSEWVEPGSGDKVDSDIQYDFRSLPMNVSDKYIFLERLDQIGNDCFIAEKHLAKYDYETMAESIDGCIAFNTLGFFKDKLTDLKVSPYFSQYDGIYVDKDYYLNDFKKKELKF